MRPLIAALLLAGCSTPNDAPVVVGALPSVCLGDSERSCTQNSECQANERCETHYGKCFLLRCSRAFEVCDATSAVALCEPGLRCDGGRCLPGEAPWEDPCRKTASCRVFGKCSTLQGVCQAWDDADCQGSEECKLGGECTAGDLARDTTSGAQTRIRHRTCWPSEPCDQALGEEEVNACAEIGLCTPSEGRCLATRLDDCKASEACTGNGACDIKDGECWREVTEDSECAAGGVDVDVCSSFGFCELIEGACNAATDAHCADSFLCQEWGECKARDGECWAVSPSP